MKRLQIVFWTSLIVKLALSALIPLTNDEAYYWVWSQHMQLSFYDHPPFVAWLFWLGQWMGFHGGMVRWPGVLLGHATLALWLLILRPFFDEQKRFYFLLLALLSPMVGGTNLLVTPDLPLLFFYALSLLVFYKWRENPTWAWAIGLGLSVGLGFTSKYMMVLFPLSVLPLVLLSRTRRPFFRQLPWMVLGLAIGTLPVWLWNFWNDFISFRFQADHGVGHTFWKPSWTSEYILQQIGIIFPPVLFWAIAARRRLPMVFHLLAWVPLLFFLMTTARGYAEANWPIAAYPPILALACASLPRNFKSLRVTIWIWALAFAALAAIILGQPKWAADTKFREFHEFDHIAQAAASLSPLYARSYQMAAKLNFQMHRPVVKLRGMNRRDFYDYMDASDPKGGGFYLAVEKGDELPLNYKSRGFKITQVIPVDERFEIWRVQGE